MKIHDFILTSKKYRLTPLIFLKDCGEWVNPYKNTVITNHAKLNRHIQYVFKVDKNGYDLPCGELLILAKSREYPDYFYVITHDKRHYCRLAKTARSYGVNGLIGSWKYIQK